MYLRANDVNKQRNERKDERRRPFLSAATRKPVPSGTTDEILEAFKVFDKEGEGFLPAVELKHTMTNLGEKFPDLDAEIMLMEAGVDADGKVNYGQFVVDMMRYK